MLGTDAVEQLVIELDEIQSLDPHVVIEHKIKQAVQYMSDSTFPDDTRFFVEDVSVSFDAMSGFPGTMIKRCIESIGVREIPRLLVDYHDKGATALCSLGYRDGQQTHFMEGHIHGQIVSPRTDR
ncbi:hypothetical protein KAZ93_04910 [Patescibacteria group bacterium]|nr:hypothetical protein [Patescibacteria group bacterium]